MRRLAIVLLGAVAFVGVSPIAEAAGKRVVTKAKPVTKAPPPAAPSSLGFYIGINGAYDWGHATFSNLAGASTGIRRRSWMVGPTFGYNSQSGSFVYGIETDIDAAWMKATNWSGPPCFGCEVRLTYFGTLRARAGYALGQALPYVTGGLAYGGVKTGLVFGASETETKAGWTVGGGVEYAVAGPWSVKAEYLYYELGRVGCSALACGAITDVKVRGNLLRLGTNFRF